MTTRDDVWDAVLVQLTETGYFKISQLPFKEDKRHTIRRILREMENLDWLSRESDDIATWRIGDKGKRHLNMSENRIE